MAKVIVIYEREAWEILRDFFLDPELIGRDILVDMIMESMQDRSYLQPLLTLDGLKQELEDFDPDTEYVVVKDGDTEAFQAQKVLYDRG